LKLTKAGQVSNIKSIIETDLDGRGKEMHHTILDLEPQDGIKQAAFEGILDSLKTGDLEKSRQAAAFAGRQDLLSAEYQDGLRRMLGPSPFDALRGIREERGKKWAAIVNDCGLGPEGQKRWEQLRGETIAAAAKVIAEAGLDRGKIRSHQLAFRQKAEAMFADFLGKDLLVDDRPKIKNHDYYPPYSGSYSTSYSAISPRRLWPLNEPFANAASGEFGAELAAAVYDASDSDWAHVFRESSILQWHYMEGPGALQVQVQARCLDSRNRGTVIDEFGWSSLSLFQQSRPFARLLYPFQSPAVFTNALAFSVYAGGGFVYQDSNNDDHSWDSIHFPAGNYQYFQVGIPGSVPAGSWALVQVGVQTVNYFWTNDTSVNSYLKSRLRLTRLGIWQA
jgi:hypothetical protein